MAGALVNVRIEDQELRELLQGIMGRMDDLRPVMREIGEVVHESVQRNFEERRSPDGKSWAPLAESTKKAKARKGRDPEAILILNRILMGSLHPEAYKDRLEYGTDMVYGAIHQFGGLAGRGHSVKIEAREYLGVRDEDWPEINRAVLDYITMEKL